jgi:hypothetical protein
MAIAASRARLGRATARLELTARDRRIIELALRKLGGGRVDFGEALRALREAVEESIRGGRVFVLGATAAGPIAGSLISGVGIVDGPGGVQLVRVAPGGAWTPLGSFGR